MASTDNRKSKPFVSIITPVAGASPSLKSNLVSYVTQNYDSFEVIFVVRDESDPAADVIDDIVHEYKRTRIVYSGNSLSCSQKNHSLLAGVREAGDKPDILVFCDSGHSAQPDWLDLLLAPMLSQSSCQVTSGYHHIYPGNNNLALLGRSICVLALNLIRQLPLFGQPWGGATAIRRETFENLSIADIWSKNIIDDVSLAQILQQKNVPVSISSYANLETRLDDSSYSGWIAWLTRQWAYLKFIFPGLWLAAGFFIFFITLAVDSIFIIWIAAIFLTVPKIMLIHSLTCFAFFLPAIAFIYSRHPQRGSFFSWFLASVTALTLGAWCHFLTWFSKTIDWANIRYHVGKNGKVTDIIRQDSQIPKVNSSN